MTLHDDLLESRKADRSFIESELSRKRRRMKQQRDAESAMKKRVAANPTLTLPAPLDLSSPAKRKRVPDGFWTIGPGHAAAKTVAEDPFRLEIEADRLALQTNCDSTVIKNKLKYYADESRKIAMDRSDQ